MAASIFRKVAKATHFHRVLSAVAQQALNLGINSVPGGNGVTFRVPPDFGGEDFVNLWIGQYERAELNLVREFFKSSRTIIDLGANIGFIGSHAFQEKLLPGGEMICVEANPSSRFYLQSNMCMTSEKSSDSKGLTFLPLALVEENGPETVSFVKCPNLSSHVLSEGRQPPAGADVVTVNTISMNDLISSFAPHHYSLICDIEGGEVALLNAESALSKCRQMVVELHEEPLAGHGYSVGKAVERFEGMGFALRGRQKNSFAFTRSV